MNQKKSLSRIVSIMLVCAFMLALPPMSMAAPRNAQLSEPADSRISGSQFPEPKDLPVFDEFLPNPFQFYGDGGIEGQTGRMVTDRDDWYDNRVPELKALAAFYEYGALPAGKQRVVTAEITSYTASSRTLALSVNVTNEENGVTETITSGRIVLPTADAQASIAGPYPVIIGTNSAPANAATMQSAGYATGFISGTFNDSLAYTGAFYRLYPIDDYDVGSYIGWAWQASVLLDAIEYLAANDAGYMVDSGELDEDENPIMAERKIKNQIDPAKAGVIGMSRWGKAAFAAGLFDERFGVTIPEDSGSGGSGVYRVAFDRVDYPWGGGDTAEMIRDLQQRFPQWSNKRHLEFTKDYSDCKYLPYDKNELVAAFAPRGIFNTTCIGNYWGNPEGVFVSHTEAKAVYEWLGVPNNIALLIQPTGHSSIQAMSATQQYLQNLIDFMDYYFRGKTPDPSSPTVNGLTRNATAPGTLPIQVGPLPNGGSGALGSWSLEQLAASPAYKTTGAWATTRPLGSPDEVVGLKSDTYLVDRQAMDGKTKSIPVIVKAINSAGRKVFADLYINGEKAQTKEVIFTPGAANGYADFDAITIDKENTYRIEACFEGDTDKITLDMEVVPYRAEWFEARIGQRYNGNAATGPSAISSHGIGGVTYGNGCYTIEFSNHEHSWDVNQRNWTRVGHTDDYKVTINGVSARAIVRDYEGPYKCCFTLVPDGPIPGADANNNLPVDAPLHIVFEGVTFPELFPGESFTIDIDHRNQRILQHSQGQSQWMNWDSEDVTRTVDGSDWIISNGLVTVTFNSTTGNVSAVRVGDSQTSLLTGSYHDAHLNQYTNPVITILEETPQKLHIVADYPYDINNYAQGGNHRIRSQRHHVFLPGINGYYEYVILDAPAQKGGVAELRTIYNFGATGARNPNGMDNLYNGELNRPHVPLSELGGSSGTLPNWAGGLGSLRTGYNLVEGPTHWTNATPRETYTKYDLPGYISETPAYGIYGNGRAAFMIYGSSEYVSGGPYKQEMLIEPNVIENYMTGAHSGGQKLNPPAGWSKTYGPWMMYFNDIGGDATDEEVLAEVLAQAEKEKAAWPYNFVVDSPTRVDGTNAANAVPNPTTFENIYPKANERATVTGKIEASGGHSLAGAMVVLSEPGVEDLIRIVNNYYFHSFADANGNFEIKNVRPGEYSLFVIPQSGSLTGQYKSEAITVGSGPVNIGTHTWLTSPRPNYLFQIGFSDRRAGEFGGTFDPVTGNIDRSILYQIKAPASLTFNVNTNVTSDWYYAQIFKSSYENAGWNAAGIPTGVWEIEFESTKTYGGEATLHLGFAGATNQPIYNIYVNGTLVETLYFSGIQDQAFYRQFSRGGRYFSREVTFDASLLAEGKNTITLENVSVEAASQPLFNGGTFIYDVIYLTTDEPGNIDSLKQLINNGVGAGEITDAARTALNEILDSADGFDSVKLAAFIAALDANAVGNDFKELLFYSATSIGTTALNTSFLGELLFEAEKRPEENYSFSGWAKFRKALDEAKAVYTKANQGNATQAEVNAARADLQAVMDDSTLRAPVVEGFRAVLYNDFDYSTFYHPWGFTNTTTGAHALMAGDVPVHGNDTRKIDIYTNGGSTISNVYKTLDTPIDGDVVLVTADFALGRALNGNANHLYDIRFLDSNGLPIVGFVKNIGTNVSAYALYDRSGNTITTGTKQAHGDAFNSPDCWYNLTAVIDKIAEEITVTITVLSGAYAGESDVMTFDYDPELTDGIITQIQIRAGGTNAGNAFFDNIGIYVAGIEEQPAVTSFATRPATIVSTLAAWLPADIAGENLEDADMAVQLVSLDGYAVVELGKAAVGANRFYLDKAPDAGGYEIVLRVNGKKAASSPLEIVPYNTDIWTATAHSGTDGKLNIRFNALISSKTNFVKAVTIAGVSYDGKVIGGDTLVVNIPYGSLTAGEKIKIAGVKFADLFPSYSFTFTISV